MEIIKVLCRGALPPETPVPPASRPATPVQAGLSAGRWPVGKAGASPQDRKLGKPRWVIIVLIVVILMMLGKGGIRIIDSSSKNSSSASVVVVLFHFPTFFPRKLINI